MTQLYGDKHTNENAALFITRKMSLFNRIDPDKPEQIKTNVILDQLQPDIRSRLRGQVILDIEALVNVVSQIETDLADIQRSVRRPNTDNACTSLPQNSRREPNNKYRYTTGPSNKTPCKFCPNQQWHYHSECPNNPYRRTFPSNNNNYRRNEVNHSTPENPNIPRAAPLARTHEPTATTRMNMQTRTVQGISPLIDRQPEGRLS